MDADPIQQFELWFAEARAAIPVDPNSMLVATVGEDGQPSARVVLLKGVDARGFVFYTNHQSRKGQELHQHPKAALCFYWPVLHRQVRVEGAAETVTSEEADAYFASRARGSQIGAWASQQSQVLDRRETLEARVKEVEARFKDRPVERPPFWSGFRVVPHRIEFWTAKESRLHDRQLYARAAPGAAWTRETLYP